MAQVNSEPGKNQVFGNVAVTAQLTTQTNPGSPAPGNQYATSVTVPYMQSEAGKIRDKGRDPDRS
jgi:hypothetical protein